MMIYARSLASLIWNGSLLVPSPSHAPAVTVVSIIASIIMPARFSTRPSVKPARKKNPFVLFIVCFIFCLMFKLLLMCSFQNPTPPKKATESVRSRSPPM